MATTPGTLGLPETTLCRTASTADFKPSFIVLPPTDMDAKPLPPLIRQALFTTIPLRPHVWNNALEAVYAVLLGENVKHAKDPGRNASYPAPPGQIPARGTTARGSYFEYLAANRS